MATLFQQPQIHTIAAAYASKRHLDASKHFQKGVAPESDEALAQLEVPGLETSHAGHDYMSFLRNVRGDPRQLLVGVADGHGDRDRGHFHSYVGTRLLANRLLSCWSIYEMHLKNYRDGDASSAGKIRQLTEYCYQEVQMLMTGPRYPSLDDYSGTTMSMALIVVVNGHRYLISTNAGDSQIIWSDPETDYQECSMDHNCDNLEAVRLYAQRLSKLRRQLQSQLDLTPESDSETRTQLEDQIRQLLPRDVYYNRINCSHLIWPQPEFLDAFGQPAPIPVFKYQGEDRDQVVLHQENYEKISKYYPTGTQSKRLPETYVREDGRTVAKPGLEAENWGSTLQGNSQLLHGFGDHQYGAHHSCQPHVTVRPISNSGRLLLATDGLTDLFYFDQLMQWFADHETDPDLVNNFYQHLWQATGDDPAYPTLRLEEKTYPRWDDVGGVFVSLPSMETDNQALSEMGRGILQQVA